MNVSCQLHSSTALPMGNKTPLAFDRDVSLDATEHNSGWSSMLPSHYIDWTGLATKFNELWGGEKDAKKMVLCPTSYSEVRNRAYHIRMRGCVIFLEKMLVHHSNSRQSIIFSHIQLHATFCYFLLWRKLLLCLRVHAIDSSLPWTDVCWVHNNTKSDSYNHSLSQIFEYCLIIKDFLQWQLSFSLGRELVYPLQRRVVPSVASMALKQLLWSTLQAPKD
jgi:hypothetical protein